MSVVPWHHGSPSKLNTLLVQEVNHKSAILSLKECSVFSSLHLRKVEHFPVTSAIFTLMGKGKVRRTALVAGADGQTWSSYVCGDETSG